MGWLIRTARLAVLCAVLACSSEDSDDGSGDHVQQDAGTQPDANNAEPSALPCSVSLVLEAKCQRCHGEHLQNGAPFALLSWSDTQRTYFDKPVHERMLSAIESGFMPLVLPSITPPVERLTDEEEQTLVAWLRAGAQPVVASACP